MLEQDKHNLPEAPLPEQMEPVSSDPAPAGPETPTAPAGPNPPKQSKGPAAKAASKPSPAPAEEKEPGLIIPALLGALAAVIVIVGAYLFLCSKPQEGVLLHHTYINDLDLSGMSVEEAETALLEQYRSTYASARADVALAGEVYPVSLGEEGILSFDPRPALDRALERGHGSFLTRGRDWIAALTDSHTAVVRPEIHSGDALNRAIAATGIGEVNTALAHQCSVEETAIRILKGGDGVSADMEALPSVIVTAFQGNPEAVVYAVDCPTVEQTVEPLDLQPIYDQVYVPVADATLDPDNDYAIVPSVVGVGFDLEDAKARFEQAEKGQELTVDLVYTQPQVSTEFLKEHLFADALGSFATDVGGSDGRRKNVRLAAERCNLILMPGQQFSYNQSVGKRTEERGFSEAGAYLNGVLIQEVGGGVCQTSSTLYMACVLSNLQIDQRQNHTYPPYYIGLGLDATVSWGGPDFKFTNNSGFPIKITSRYSSGVLSFTIYGTNLEGTSVQVESKVVSGSGKGRTYRSTASATNGGQSVAYTGRKAEVVTYRNVYDASGKLLSSTREAGSFYQDHQED